MTRLRTSFAVGLILLSVIADGLLWHVVIDREPPASIQNAGNPTVRVWVNTNSGVYHCPNTTWYGRTKSGQFMTQREAQAKGYRPAYGAVCG